MARTPKKKSDRLVVYPKQWPEYPADKMTRPGDMPTPPNYEETETMTNKTFNQFVTEAAKRGRPRKLRPGEEADTLHIQDQLSKLTHPNHVELHFKDGSKHNIPREHANKALQHLSSLKPIDRADHAEHMGKGHSEFYHVLTKKSIPDKKPKITLAGPKLRKEENENDDGWYAHKEMHGSKAVSKEDWKKGVRLNKDGKRVQKEEVEYSAELLEEIYEALSEEGKALFEKMSSDQLAKMVSVYHAKGGKTTVGKYNQPRESEKSFPASKMKGSKWASTAGSIKRKNQGYKK